MILEMRKVRILGPRDRLPGVLAELQDLGLVHLCPVTETDAVRPLPPDRSERRRRRQLERILDDIDAALAALPAGGGPEGAAGPPPAAGPAALARIARLADGARREAEALATRVAAREAELAQIERYQALVAEVVELLRGDGARALLRAFAVVLRAGQRETVGALREQLTEAIGDGFELRARELPGGETALLLLVPLEAASTVEAMLAEGRVAEVPLPPGFEGATLMEAIPTLVSRREAIRRELATLRRDRRRLARRHRPPLLEGARAVRDALTRLDALGMVGHTRHAFVLEGWLPADAEPRLLERLAGAAGDTVVVETVAEEEWAGEQAPVVLRNPRLFQPFELLTALLPRPRYGTIDPTPFVAVFFPAFFGLILGDVGYGLALGALGLVLRRGAPYPSLRRSLAEIARACALFTVLFGVLYGELFGDLGRHWLGMRPLLFDREEAVLPFLGLAVALGLVHVVVGLGLGMVSAWPGHGRRAIGRGVMALMVLLIVAALLAALKVLPSALLTPSVVALLVAFPVLVLIEGLVAPVELLSTLGNILSYARIMAVGTASVMLAVVANRMAGAVGSAVVGVVFALLFHLVNFGLGLFSPTIHALRLHYVEFFGQFYSPGGATYRPLTHWTSGPSHAR